MTALFAPKGPKQASPGQRPGDAGNARESYLQALKGRNDDDLTRTFVPPFQGLRGEGIRLPLPGRCPGLDCFGPFGASSCRRARGFHASLAAALLLLAGCRNDMYEQPRYEPLEPSSFFEDGKSSRPLVAGTVPRQDVRGAAPKGADEDVFYSGWDKGRLAETVPFPVDKPLLERGRQRYQIYCVPCHAESGDGRGMIVRRGFNPPPPYYSDELLKQPIGHFFDVMTRGYGTMYSYATRIPPRDRWAIASYIRVLQLSQHATAAELPEQDRQKLPAQGQGEGQGQSRRAQP